jgi:biotin/methionine sulfoxide reductase
MVQLRPHSSHWGAYSAGIEGGVLTVVPHPGDADPSPLLRNIPSAVAHPARIAMHRIVTPFGEARDEYAIFAELAGRLGAGEAFTEGRSAAEWLRVLYEQTRSAIGDGAPDFDTFWERGELPLPIAPDDGGPMRAFRLDPDGAPLPTPSGKVEIFSSTIAGYGYADCPGHAVWIPPLDGVGSPALSQFPLQLVANQPANRLHSQLDFGAASQEGKLRGREPVRIHPDDASVRGIGDGDIVRLFNDRGGCLAAAVVSEDIRKGVIQLATGAWYDPEVPEEDAPLCVHGNPNVVTRDVGTSRLSQGCSGQLTCVQLERFTGNLPPVRAFIPPVSGEI